MFKSNKKVKKIVGMALAAVMAAGLLAGCGGNATDEGNTNNTGSTFDTSKIISVVSREDGSGTRGAFIELLGIEEKDADGNKKDNTTKEAVIAMRTDIMMTNIANDPYAIGYASLGSLNDTVKALAVDGVEANAENIKNGNYKIARPFNIATKGEPAGLAKDFIGFILSKEGQEVVAESYIKIDDNAEPYSGTKPEGKIVVAGSSSVTPVMEKLKEAYLAINPNAQIEVQQSDSSTGMSSAMEGICDIGMASRELKDSEKAELTATAIAMDGIAIIVNPVNSISDITAEAAKEVFVGNITTWSELVK
ncbi:MAG: substrate-binding domain-containing protein [Clostridia bacterium]|jgi:phosphate transport system substrate-binding protein|nr:substrate-binding domain-containing protein [Clostridia bacterium]